MLGTEGFLAFAALTVVSPFDFLITSIEITFTVFFNNFIMEGHLVFGVGLFLLLFFVFLHPCLASPLLFLFTSLFLFINTFLAAAGEGRRQRRGRVQPQ